MTLFRSSLRASCLSRVSGSFSPTGIPFFSHRTYTRRSSATYAASRGRIVIPALPADPEVVSNHMRYGAPSSFVPEDHVEYAQHMRYSAELEASHLPPPIAAVHRSQQRLSVVREEEEKQLEKMWRESKPHLRRQEALIKELGSVEAAAEELVSPTRLSFRSELQQRPLDKGILEEIYTNLHGKRIERQLKKGLTWEHWIAKGDGTAPVFTASRKAQQAFGVGGVVRLVARAVDRSQFPPVSTQEKRGAGRINRCAPEFAFVGRTSSGKSSLINALVNAAVAPYGHLQGTTRSVDFFAVGPARQVRGVDTGVLTLVDCPGYGYYHPMQATKEEGKSAESVMEAYLRSGATRTAKTAEKKVKNGKKKRKIPQKEAAVRGEETLIDVANCEEGDKEKVDTLETRLIHNPHIRPLRRVFVCVSSRGLQHVDWACCDRLESLGIKFSVVLTKTDAAPIKFLARLADYTRARLVGYRCCNELMLTSALRLAGIDKLQNLIGSMALDHHSLSNAKADDLEDWDPSAIV